MPQVNHVATAPIIELGAVDSSNQEAIRRITAGEAGPLWLIAESQHSGRGRLGRTWTSETGNLFCSFICPSGLIADSLNFLPYIVGLSIAQALERAGLGRDIIRLKWPNDVLLEGKKVSGVLIERTSVDAPVVIGIGVNVTHYPSDAQFPATHVGAYTDCLAPELLHHLRTCFAAELGAFRTYGTDVLMSKWRDRAWGLGSKRVIRTHAETFEALLESVADDGGLVISRDGTRQTVYAGDVF